MFIKLLTWVEGVNFTKRLLSKNPWSTGCTYPAPPTKIASLFVTFCYCYSEIVLYVCGVMYSFQ